MRSIALLGAVSGLVLSAAVVWTPHGERSLAAQQENRAPMLAHMVYFTLKDNSPAAIEHMVQACQKYLSGHEGTVFFAAGTLAQDLDRPVNVRDFDVALHLVFRDKAAHDKYQDHPRHIQFIDENKANWKQVRVFDAYIAHSGAR
jgi:hypothetical protein